MKPHWIIFAAALLALVPGCATRLDSTQNLPNARFEFALIGDVPYNDFAATNEFPNLIADLTRSGGRLRLVLELIDPRDGTAAWTRPYPLTEAELESVAAIAASDLAAWLGAPRSVAPTSRDPAAYRAYRNGRGSWARRDHANLVQAIASFEEALRIDPDYAAAWVGLVDANLLLPWVGPTPRRDAYARAQAALTHAIALAPDSAEVQAARGTYLVEAEWQFAGGADAYRRAIALDPDDASTHQWLAEALGFGRRFDEALVELDVAIKLDPRIAAIHKIRSRTLFYANRVEEALAAAEQALALDPTQPWVRYGRGYALVRLGRFDEGLAEIKAEALMQAPGMEPIVVAQELWVASRRGDQATVARLRAQLDASTLAQGAPFVAAFVAAIVGDRDRMLDLLERGVAEHDPWLPQVTMVAEFDPYRRDPRFAALIARFDR